METVIPINRDEAVLLLGPGEQNLRAIEKGLGISIVSRGGILKVSAGSAAGLGKAQRLFEAMRKHAKHNGMLNSEDISSLVRAQKRSAAPGKKPNGLGETEIIVQGKREAIRTKTAAQLKLLRAIRESDVVFAIGPAGTGKTFVAVAAAVNALISGEIDRIIITRPAIEAGESLGFLPGDLKEKVDPYLRPIHDALFDILSKDQLQLFSKKDFIEIAPIAYMRGRTLSNACAILDEAQNCTMGQMKMFLTRLGVNSKAIVTGDITQIDLKKGVSSGLVEIQKVLKRMPGIKFCYFSSRDVVRHKLVKRIVDAYEKYEGKPNEFA